MRLPLLALMMICAPVLSAHADDDLANNPNAFRQIPTHVTVDYAVAKDGALHLIMNTTPPLTGCGKMSDLPVMVRPDFEAVDVVIDQYYFVRPVGTNASKECGPTYKVATAHATVEAQDIAANDIKRIRFWYKQTLDTVLIQPAGRPGDVILTPLGTPKIFSLGKKRSSVPTIAPSKTDDAVNTITKTPNLVLLSTGDDAIDQIVRTALTEMAESRGFKATDDPDLFLDKGGQYYKQLATQKAIEIGAVMYQGTRQPVYAIRLDQGH